MSGPESKWGNEFGEPTIPDSETLSMGQLDIKNGVEEGKETVFTVPQDMLRYKVTVEPIEEPCARDGCDGVPQYDGYCSLECLEEDNAE